MTRPSNRPERREGTPLLLAEAPARGGNDPLDGLAGDRLARYAGYDCRAELLRDFDAWNLLGRWPGSSGKGSTFPLALARRAARRTPLTGVVLLLGSRVAAAYGLLRTPLWTWTETPSGKGLYAVLPHPSGVCRTYNEEPARLEAGHVLAQAQLLAHWNTTTREEVAA